MTMEAPKEEMPELPDAPELLQQIDLYDQTRAEFLNACDAYSSMPSPENTANVGLCGSLLIKTFGKSVEAMAHTGMDIDSRIDMLSTLMIVDDTERITRFKAKTECPSFEYLKDSVDIADEMKEAALDAEGEEDFGESLLTIYQEFLQDDLDHFVQHFSGNPPAEQQSPISELSRKYQVIRAIGWQALDVAKLGSGVAIGIWIARH